MNDRSLHFFTQPHLRRAAKAFTLVEVLIAVSVLAVIAGLAVSSFGGFKGSVEQQKLANDVNTLNSAISLYIISGGSLDKVTDPIQVIDKLKTVVDADLEKRMPGSSSSLIDRRLTAITTTSVPTEVFAEWIPADSQFKVVTNKSPSQSIRIVAFELGTPPASVVSEAREPSMKFSKVSKWIWDYQDRALDPRLAPSAIPLSILAPPSNPLATVVPPPPAPPVILASPDFSLPGAGLPDPMGNFIPWTKADYPLSITLIDPNPAGAAEIIFWVNGNAPGVYSGQTLTLFPDDLVTAYAKPLNPTSHIQSSNAQEVYTATLVNPNLNFSIGVSSSGP